MNDDERLRALFEGDAPPMTDPAFVSGVMKSLARRRFLLELVGVTSGAVSLGVVLWGLWPALGPLANGLGQAAGAVGAAAGLAVIVLWGVGVDVQPDVAEAR